MSSNILSLPKNLLYKFKVASDLFPMLSTTKRGSLSYDSINQSLLLHYGCIHHASRGSYAILPLMNRSLKKLKALIDEEMNHIGAQEILLPHLVSRSLWEKSGRLNQDGALKDIFTLKDRRKKDYLLGPTHEEGVTQLVADLKPSYKRLPLLLYQIASKFRDEPRTKHGLMRTTEFIMKDLYTFDESIEQAICTYEKIGDVYERILTTLGLNYIKALSDVGNIGGILSHEYQLLAASGEDIILLCDECKSAWNKEYLTDDRSKIHSCDRCNGTKFVESKGVEVGHTFLLSTTYSKPMNAMFITKEGKQLPLQMGCFGLGLTRILAASIDILSTKTEDGQFQMRWPNKVAPFQVCIILPKEGSSNDTPEVLDIIRSTVKTIINYEDLDVLLDDRNSLSIGRRLSDIKSLGIPNIMIIDREFSLSKKIEFHKLDETTKATYTDEFLHFDDFLGDITKFLNTKANIYLNNTKDSCE